MQFRLVIVEPHYQINIGYMARIAKNFGISRLYIVSPKCKYNGKNAIKYSKHAHALVENARICKSIGEACRGFTKVGTTAIWQKAYSGMNNVYELSDFKKKFEISKAGKVALIIGRDTTGLTSEEMSECDSVVYIGADDRYPTLNISHALAVLLYEILGNVSDAAKENFGNIYANDSEVRMLENLFARFVDGNGNIRKKDMVKRAFSHVLRRSNPTKSEIATLLVAFGIKKNRKR
ncbi:MAG: RNA methyltransferase [Candidatus Marsarchaeota archaeon]|nr:RNA methyltransferase [Candidatus Marsarchaeota archaeon]